MDTRKVTLVATIAVIALVAVGIGYAYTAATSNSGNNVGAEYITITQEQTGAYQFAKDGTFIYWDSSDYRENIGTSSMPFYVYKTAFSISSNLIINNAESKGIPGYDVVQLGDTFDVFAKKTNGSEIASVKCQIIPTAFTYQPVEGLDIFLKVTGATGSAQYFKLVDDNTFVLMNETVTAVAGDNQFTINKDTYVEETKIENFNKAHIQVFAGYVTASTGVVVKRAAPTDPVPAAINTLLNGSELKFAIHVPGANNPSGTKVSTVTIKDGDEAKTETTAVKGSAKTLSATTDGTNQGVKWSSSNTSVISFADPTVGTFTPAAAGVAIVTATANEGGVIGTCIVTVTADVTGVNVKTLSGEDSATVVKGKSIQLVAVIAPTDATNKNVTWTDSDTTEGGVDVSTSGVVTIPAATELTEVTITATTEDGSETDTLTITITAS